ncbi:hypothetical protein N0V85_003897 [Neurospora sp. IMI 360204]|nr:hypothetical protein N0V85_003897 [Neurospora sp. IMI 360204]
MGRSGYDTTNFRDTDPNHPPPRRAGMGLIAPPNTASQQDPKGKGKERADGPSGAQTSHTHLLPVRRSADFREAAPVVEPFPVLPQYVDRRRSGFGLDVGPRAYAGAGGGSRTRPRALELGAGSSNNPIDVEMGGTSASSSAGPAGTGGGIGDDDLKTPRASQFAVPDNFPRAAAASRSSQPYLAHNQVHNQYNGLSPPPPRILRSQASQFGFTTNKSSSGGNGNFHTQSQGSRSQPINLNRPASSQGNTMSSGTGTSAYDFGSSCSPYFGMSESDARDFYLRTVTPHPGPAPFGLSFSPEEWGRPSESMTAAASTPRTAARPPPGFPPGFNTGSGQGQGPRLEDRGFPFFPQPVTQAEKDRRRKAALDAGFDELLAKRQKRNH